MLGQWTPASIAGASWRGWDRWPNNRTAPRRNSLRKTNEQDLRGRQFRLCRRALCYRVTLERQGRAPSEGFSFVLSGMADILNVGFDAALLTTRRLNLERAGHRVAQAHDLRQVLAACERKSVDVVILCHTLNESEKMRVADVVRRFCGDAMLLDLQYGSGPDLPYADAHLQTPAGRPRDLLRAVDALSHKSRAV